MPLPASYWTARLLAVEADLDAIRRADGRYPYANEWARALYALHLWATRKQILAAERPPHKQGEMS